MVPTFGQGQNWSSEVRIASLHYFEAAAMQYTYYIVMLFELIFRVVVLVTKC
jgi:hypothetical protein